MRYAFLFIVLLTRSVVALTQPQKSLRTCVPTTTSTTRRLSQVILHAVKHVDKT